MLLIYLSLVFACICLSKSLLIRICSYDIQMIFRALKKIIDISWIVGMSLNIEITKYHFEITDHKPWLDVSWCGIELPFQRSSWPEKASLQLHLSFCLTWLLRNCWRRKTKPNQRGEAFLRFVFVQILDQADSISYTVELVEVFGTCQRSSLEAD